MVDANVDVIAKCSFRCVVTLSGDSLEELLLSPSGKQHSMEYSSISPSDLTSSSSYGSSSTLQHGGEHITLQFGNYSNFVGAHYWNFLDELFGRKSLEAPESPYSQERFYYEKMYRSRTEQGRAMYYPRVMMFDLKGRAGYLHPEAMKNATKPVDERLHGIFGRTRYGAEGYGNAVANHWSGEVKVVQSQPIERNSFFDYLHSNSIGGSILDGEGDTAAEVEDEDRVDEDEYVIDSSNVTSWTNFLQAKLQDDSLMELPNFTSSELNPFDTFFCGTSYETIDKKVREDYIDVFRCLMEECDRVSCVNVMADIDDGFSGLAASFIEEIREEVPRAFLPIWAFTDPSQGKGKVCRKAVDPLLGPQYGALSLKSCNLPLFYSKAHSFANVIFPIDSSCSDNIAPCKINSDGTFYHTAAIVAAAMDTVMSSNYVKNVREGHNSTDLSLILGEVTQHGKYKFVDTELCFPADSFTHNSAHHYIPNGGILTSFTSSLSSAACGPWASGTTRTEEKFNVYSKGFFSRGLNCDLFRQKCLDLQTQPERQIGQQHLHLDSVIVPFNASSILTPVPIPVSYPDFFSKIIRVNEVQKTMRPLDAGAIATCGRSSLMPEHLKKVLRNWNECSKASSCRAAQWEKVGLPIEERLEISECLEQIVSTENDEF